jgi:hypothetical protein
VSTPDKLPLNPEPAEPPPARAWPLAPEPEPLFGLLEVIVAFVALLVAMVACGVAAVAIAHRLPALHALPVAELAERPMVLLPAQLAAYLLLIALLWRLFTHYHRVELFAALRWQWPHRWLPLLAAGAALAVAVQLAAHLLPIPQESPIDKMIQTTRDAWLMSVFGVLVAPLVEEILFRGLLFPALARKVGAALSVLVTALLFGAMHAQQLGGDWIEVGLIVLVGALLTVVRWRTHSLACSTLVHVGYNATLFGAMFVQSHGFSNFNIK